MPEKKTLLTLLLLFLLLAISSAADATLVDRGGGLIYDTWLDVTWLRDANMARTMGLSKDGLMTASEAMKWAADLVYQGYTGWRLPDARNLYKSQPREGWKVRTSELGHLYYDELGNSATMKIDDRSGLRNNGPFINLQPFRYWTNTKYHMPSDFWWYFDMGNGYQWAGLASARSYAWAVRDGISRPLDLNKPDAVPIPQPPSYMLEAPPELVAIPNTEVSAVWDSKVDIFSYHGYWWRSFEGRWYRCTGYNGPWSYVRPEMVPRALIDLPPDYKKHLGAATIIKIER